MQCRIRTYDNDHILKQNIVFHLRPGERVCTASPNNFDLKVAQIGPFLVIVVLVAGDHERLCIRSVILYSVDDNDMCDWCICRRSEGNSPVEIERPKYRISRSARLAGPPRFGPPEEHLGSKLTSMSRQSGHIPTLLPCGLCRITCSRTISCLRMMGRHSSRTHFDIPPLELQV